MSERFRQRLADGPVLVADGGMGVLVSSAVPRLRCPEEANVRAPEAVLSLHLGFIRAGADLIETNTFGANRPKLAAHFLEDEFERINSAGVKLARDAREVAGREVFIGASIGPLGERTGFLTDSARRELFAEQASILEGRGADLFMIETFYDLEELVAAIEAVQSVSTLPIVALLTFDTGAETLAGVRAAEAAEALSRYDLAAVGANHGSGLMSALEALEQMGSDGRPLAALPNLGLASLSGGRVIYPHATPEYFAEFAAHARELGAHIIGGCCGTTPTEIAAICRALAEERAPSAPFVFAERRLAARAESAEAETGLARKLRERQWIVSVQLDPPLGASNAGLLAVARDLEQLGGIEFVDLNDNATARVGMNSLMTSIAIERASGLETIPHLTPRDTTIMGLQSALLGAHADGIRNVLAVTGDPPEVGDYPGSRGVYEVDAIGLCRLISRLNAGEDFNGRAIDAPTSFFVGVAVNPTADDLDVELERFEQKIEAGAAFAMTQILFDLSYLDRFLERLGGASPIPLLVGLWWLRSYQLALRLHNEVPGIVVPEQVQERIRAAGADAPAVGLELQHALYREAREKAAGVYVVAPFRKPVEALQMIPSD